MANNLSLQYIGKVTLSYYVNGNLVRKKVHNNGLPYLMKTFAKCITGNTIVSSDIPQYLDVRKKADDDTWQSILLNLIPLSGKTYQYATDQEMPNWVAKFTSSINYSSLKSEIQEDDKSEYRLYLSSDTDKESTEKYHDFAYLDVQAVDLAKVSPGTQALVEWTMQINNPEGV